MSIIPETDAEWAEKLSKMKKTLPSTLSATPIPTSIHHTIDHTLLSTPIEPSQIDTLCQEALDSNFATVCVRLEHVARAVSHVKNSTTGVACVVGFPEGTHPTADKVREAQEAVAQGAAELDMVIRYSLLKEGRYKEVYEDVHAVRKAAPAPTILKTILEASLLSEDELLDATIVCCLAGADFVKTSTGWHGGASVEQVRLMRAAVDVCGVACRIKASGGIRSARDAVKMLKAGAHRIGTSSGMKIMREVNDEEEVLEQGCSHDAY
ncbi:Aldolase-type TIM barrel [Penicillium bovifimosum]|uniref:deoxyribose-phosphate aldolase n=1 Tax=Penicillium bovifimosum TaxID=126998 RepID=A0A9W9GML4_9EURO|nr:Aldolase-type TIM barrel [Penicillium bovifimosum]KAJ5124222.1 Aldolase-type TIM barrel [Penicillium bovifimosum]